MNPNSQLKTIPPSERYNQHIRQMDITADEIREVSQCFGLKTEGTDIKKLTGGFQNSNYLIAQGAQKLVLRFYSTDPETAQREFAVLDFLGKQNVATPHVHEWLQHGGRGIILMDYVEGQLLQERLLEKRPLDAYVFHSLGQELARIHSIELPRAGFIGPEMKIGSEYDSFGPFLKEYIVQVFSHVAEDRLQPSTRDRLLNLVEEHWHLVLETEPASHLVHCDFNPKNILISTDATPTVAAVLDWEFCISGNGLIDLGNFFRFPNDYPESAEGEFIAGYRSVRPALSGDWKRISLLMDLGNMASFMERKEDYRKTFRTARAVIESTLDFFDNSP